MPLLAVALHESKAVLELGDPEGEILDLLATRDAGLRQCALHGLLATAADPLGLSAPRRDRVTHGVSHLGGVDTEAAGEVVGESVGGLGAHARPTDACKQELRERVRPVVFDPIVHPASVRAHSWVDTARPTAA